MLVKYYQDKRKTQVSFCFDTILCTSQDSTGVGKCKCNFVGCQGLYRRQGGGNDLSKDH